LHGNRKRRLITDFPTPENYGIKHLRSRTFGKKNSCNSERRYLRTRFYQEIATNRVLDAIAEEKIDCYYCATGTETAIGFQFLGNYFMRAGT